MLINIKKGTFEWAMSLMASGYVLRRKGFPGTFRFVRKNDKDLSIVFRSDFNGVESEVETLGVENILAIDWEVEK